MTGYEVVTTDDDTIGTVVDDRGAYLIVEHGKLIKSRHALPKIFAHPVDADRLVRVTLSKQLVLDSPKIDDGFDDRAVAQHYGLASGYEQPETEGEGVLLPDDPAESAAVEGARRGIDPPDKTRAEIREGHHGTSGPHVSGRLPNAADPFGQTATR